MPQVNPQKSVRPPPDRRRRRSSGLGQLSLVEHALCPLDAKSSLRPNLVFDASYLFTDQGRHTRAARATVHGPLGLSASDEFYLWGLLALTFAAPDPDNELHATPHYCLRRLGMVDERARRGGRQYRQFADALERLSAVRYRNDHFYDPVRAEHRRVSFGFLSYSLPLDPESCRAWRIVWDPVFFEYTMAVGGYLRFDLDLYRGLDPAARRLFLFLAKIFSRRPATPRLDVRHLGENLIGFSPTLDVRDMKVKVARAVGRLADLGVVERGTGLFEKRGKGSYSLVLVRGGYFSSRERSRAPHAAESPLLEPLREIGFDEATAIRLVRAHPARVLREWVDITLAARERFGASFFRKSPQAYLIDNLKNAARGNRTPPDWWHALRKAEATVAERRTKQDPASPVAAAGDPGDLAGGAPGPIFARVREEMLSCFLAAGQPRDVASRNAERFAREHLRRRAV